MLTILLVCFWAVVFCRIDFLIPRWRNQEGPDRWWQVAVICYVPFIAAITILLAATLT
jgi:hypothetical protein